MKTQQLRMFSVSFPLSFQFSLFGAAVLSVPGATRAPLPWQNSWGWRGGRAEPGSGAHSEGGVPHSGTHQHPRDCPQRPPQPQLVPFPSFQLCQGCAGRQRRLPDGNTSLGKAPLPQIPPHPTLPSPAAGNWAPGRSSRP